MDTSETTIHLNLTWPSRLLLGGLMFVLDVCIWLAYWSMIDLSPWAEDLTDSVMEGLKWEVEIQTNDAQHD